MFILLSDFLIITIILLLTKGFNDSLKNGFTAADFLENIKEFLIKGAEGIVLMALAVFLLIKAKDVDERNKIIPTPKVVVEEAQLPVKKPVERVVQKIEDEKTLAALDRAKRWKEGERDFEGISSIEIIYDIEGKKRKSIEYANKDVKNGIEIIYHSNGNVAAAIPYEDNLKKGTAIIFSQNGDKHIEISYSRGLKYHDYYEYNGDIIVCEGNYTDDLPHGDWSYYDHLTGKLLKKERYYMGRKK